MELYFLRHGKAVEPGTPGVADDFSRPLTDKGIAEMEAEAKAMKRLGVRPDVILTSPLVRARDTAHIVARHLGREQQLIETDLLSLGCDLGKLRKLLSEHGAGGEIMLVGHEPDFSSIVGELIGGSASSVEIKKGTVALVSVARSVRPGGGVLQWLIPAKVLVDR